MSKSEAALERIKQMDRAMITPAIIAPVIGSDEHTIRLRARSEPERFGFPVMCIGNRVKIPRKPFIQFMDSLR